METKLNKIIQKLYHNYDYKVCLEYFSNGTFLDDCIKYFDKENVNNVLEYITDTVYDINNDYRYKEHGEIKLKEMLKVCIKMLNNK